MRHGELLLAALFGQCISMRNRSCAARGSRRAIAGNSDARDLGHLTVRIPALQHLANDGVGVGLDQDIDRRNAEVIETPAVMQAASSEM